MRFDEPRSKPLWLERSDQTWGTDLTGSEFDAELDDLPPRHLRLIHGVPATTGTRPGADPSPTVAPLHRTSPAGHPSLPGPAGNNFPDAA